MTLEPTYRLDAPDHGPTFDNIVLTWNQAALDTIRQGSIEHPPEDPPYASRALAMESIAVHDVLQAIHDKPGYLVNLDAPAGISAEAAVSAAAHEILAELYPDSKAALDHVLISSLSGVPDGRAEHQGIAFGTAVADAVIAARAHDGSDGLAHLELVAGHEPGEYRPTPPDFTPALQPDWGEVTPFALKSGDQFRPDGPPALTSAAYTAAFNEVKELGDVNSTTRTPEQTEIAIWWSNDENTSTPVGQWNDIADHLLADQARSLEDSAFLLTELNVGLADTLIAGWDAKYTYNFWRPVTAIHDANADGNPATKADADWSSLLPSPGHPNYVSGHSVIGETAAKVMTDFFGPIPFTGTSETQPGVVRHFDNFEQAAKEEAVSRIYGGVHFPFSTEDGLALGGHVGDWVVDTFHQKLDIPSSDGHLV